MKSIARGSAIAAIATAFVLGYGTSTTSAQDAALGANAELAAKGVWDANITYAKDDVVTARGSAWISLKAGNKNHVPGQTSPSSAAWWRLFARGFSPLGAWVNTTKYQPDDLVTFNGQTYRAKVTNLNKSVANATFWELLVTKGANGAAGATGPQGPAGPNTGIGSGTSSAPSISFTGDPDTGIFHPSADKIALVEGGTLFLHNLGPSSNTALGLGALENTIESFNTAVGYHALNANSSGSSNAAFGDGALEANTNGVANTAIGSFAMNANKTGNWNTAVGAGTLDVNISGARNVAVGHHALQNSLTDDNTAIGFLALQAQTNGNSNTAVGATALTANTDGNYNVAVGPQALSSNQAGSGNVAIGAAAMISNTIGSGNLAVGGGALGSNADGGNNVSLGYLSLNSLNGGGDNIAIGKGAGSNLTAGASNIFIGNASQATEDNTIRIGTQGTQQTTFIAGIRGIVTGEADAINVVIDSNGQLGTTSSSRRYKYDIETMAGVSAMLAKLRPVTFRYKQSQSGAHPLQYGLIAEEVADVFPDLAVFNTDGSAETVKYHLLPSFLLAGWQAQQQTIAAQADKIEALEERLRRLETLLPQTKAVALQ